MSDRGTHVTDLDGKQLERTLSLIFLSKGEKLSNYVPEFWRFAVAHLLEDAPEKHAAAAKLDTAALRIMHGVSPPEIIKQVNPNFSSEAKVAHIEGVCLLAIVVDQNGEATQIEILRALGMGLDEKAVEALKKWRFKPAMKDGKPVAVLSNVEMTFHLD